MGCYHRDDGLGAYRSCKPAALLQLESVLKGFRTPSQWFACRERVSDEPARQPSDQLWIETVSWEPRALVYALCHVKSCARQSSI